MSIVERTYKKVLVSINNGAVPPWLQKTAWKWWYQILARRWRDGAWTFMNYGWLPPEGAPPIPLSPADEADRCFIGQYHRLAVDLPIQGGRVLEVGSGRGGGSSYIARTFGPTEMVGLDFSGAAVALSRKLHAGVPHLRFVEGDAEALPFPDTSFDAVVNVESSHCYGNMPKFVAEVARVLRPGGRFGWSDLRGPGMMPATDSAFAASGLRLVSETDITADVVRALDAANDRKMAAIATQPVGQALLRQFSATKGTTLYGALKNGHVRYLSRVYEK
ncbi:class I SAM-dependent methyltransferase [Novispirillum sp. DQ9]|uniref:class I SAM-dependent methyltransferase n=1 Tax=Novispirillum sp. DQ9 TaxID=3398612 RepID=UPI003C7DA4FB